MTNDVNRTTAQPGTMEGSTRLRAERSGGARPAVAGATAERAPSRWHRLLVRLARALGPGPEPLEPAVPRHAWEQGDSWEATTRMVTAYRA